MTSWAVFLLAASLLGIPAAGQQPTPGAWGDQQNGTFANPILPADFSDLDAIRVGNTFYAISSTFQYSPGMVILRSRDLVNWQVAGHVVDDLRRISPALNWDRMDRAGRGIWAGSIRFHQGRFWVVFGTPDEGLFLSTAAKIEGPWTPVEAVLPQPGWDDPCPFWDDDGQMYLVATRFKPDPTDGTPYKIHLFKLSADGHTLDPASDRIIHQSRGSEANKLDKINGLYYHFFSEVHPEGRVPMMERARSLAGPWEAHQLLHVDRKVDKEPNQGGLIQLPSGAWYFLTHQGTGDWEGRAMVLLPVTWIDRWPIPGSPGPDGIGNMVWTAAKPISGQRPTLPIASDNFTSPILKPEWEWNYQPRGGMWSLTERPRHLRLHAFPSLVPGDFQKIGNILTQRSMRVPHAQVTVRLELAGMADGQQAGLAHFSKSYAAFAVRQDAPSQRTLILTVNGTLIEGPFISTSTLWLRSTWGLDGLNQFAYSTDGVTFTNFGKPTPMTWGNYRGDRIGLYTVNDRQQSGFVDIDSFQYLVTHAPHNMPTSRLRIPEVTVPPGKECAHSRLAQSTSCRRHIGPGSAA